MLKQKYKKILFILTLFIIAIGAYFLLSTLGQDNTVKQTTLVDSEAQTTSNEPTAQADFSEGDETRDPGNSLVDGGGSASVTGSDDATVEKTSDPITSEDGKTSVYTPVSEQLISSGSKITGNTKNDNLYFRLIDEKVGVIGEGKLSIKGNGDFTGKFNIENHSNKGRLDIFSRNSDGTEYSTIYIDVRFNNGG